MEYALYFSHDFVFGGIDNNGIVYKLIELGTITFRICLPLSIISVAFKIYSRYEFNLPFEITIL